MVLHVEIFCLTGEFLKYSDEIFYFFDRTPLGAEGMFWYYLTMRITKCTNTECLVNSRHLINILKNVIREKRTAYQSDKR